MAIIPFILVGLGIALIIIGCTISLIDWNRKHKREKEEDEVITEPTSLPETLDALTKLADALRGHLLGMQLIFIGIVLLVIAGLWGGVALALTS